MVSDRAAKKRAVNVFVDAEIAFRSVHLWGL